MKPVCYLDLDGVLVDFVRGTFALHERHLHLEDVTWGFPAQIGFTGVEDPTFWAPMGMEFWSSLPWTDEGPSLLSLLETLFGDRIVLMTSPCDTPGAVEGKVEWIRKNLPNYRRRFFVGPPKHLAAGPGKILIDDYEGNADSFVAEGGQAVLVPRPWNRRRNQTIRGDFDPILVAAEAAQYEAL